MAQQDFNLLALAAAAPIVTDGAVFGETAGALDERELVVATPRDNIILADAVHRTYEFHALKVL